MKPSLGTDQFLKNRKWQESLKKKRIAFLGHAASVTSNGMHSMDALARVQSLNLVCAFGPQHGMRSEKQDNMIESADYHDPVLNIPVFSLYGASRKPDTTMMDAFDVLLVDLQDIGARVYTYSTTLFYMLDACAETSKQVWVFDRPNPAGRAVEGTLLEKGWESFIGNAPLIMRHGLTLGELARWYVKVKSLDIDLNVVAMTGYQPDEPPGYGWPLNQLAWVNPSPNASSINMVRCFPGTVLFEGTNLSEGRGTTTPLEMVGAPDLDFRKLLNDLEGMAPEWTRGAILRHCHFEPVYDKHQGNLCSGLQIHTDHPVFNPYIFKPFRLAAGLLKAIRNTVPDYDLWREGPFEYEHDKQPVDLLNGGPTLRTWVEDPKARAEDLERILLRDEEQWLSERSDFLLY
jgi:uncharacterized protein YbbC (DUF1343 family)